MNTVRGTYIDPSMPNIVAPELSRRRQHAARMRVFRCDRIFTRLSIFIQSIDQRLHKANDLVVEWRILDAEPRRAAVAAICDALDLDEIRPTSLDKLHVACHFLCIELLH